MRVRQGWSGEVKPNTWGKCDIECDEEDLRRILMSHPNYDPGVRVSTVIAYGLLEAEVEALLTHKIGMRYNINSGGAMESMDRLKAVRKTLLDRLYGVSNVDAQLCADLSAGEAGQ